MGFSGGPAGALPPTIGGPFSSLGYLGAASIRKPFEGSGSPLVPSKIPTSLLPNGPLEPSSLPTSAGVGLPPLIPARREVAPPPHPMLPNLRHPFLPPSLYPAALALASSQPSPLPYPPSMSSFHSVLASLSAYRPHQELGGVGADYASLLRAAAASSSVSSGSHSPPSPDRRDSAAELRIKAREFEMKLEQQQDCSSKINTES